MYDIKTVFHVIGNNTFCFNRRILKIIINFDELEVKILINKLILGQNNTYWLFDLGKWRQIHISSLYMCLFLIKCGRMKKWFSTNILQMWAFSMMWISSFITFMTLCPFCFKSDLCMDVYVCVCVYVLIILFILTELDIYLF
jgi:hypothetical protein